MSLFNSNQYEDYPAYWVQIRLNNTSEGSQDVGFWIVAPTDLGTGISAPSFSNGDVFDSGRSLLSGLPTVSGDPDSERVPSLLGAIKTWAEGYSWGGSITVGSVNVMQVNEAYSDVSPS